MAALTFECLTGDDARHRRQLRTDPLAAHPARRPSTLGTTRRSTLPPDVVEAVDALFVERNLQRARARSALERRARAATPIRSSIEALRSIVAPPPSERRAACETSMKATTTMLDASTGIRPPSSRVRFPPSSRILALLVVRSAFRSRHVRRCSMRAKQRTDVDRGRHERRSRASPSYRRLAPSVSAAACRRARHRRTRREHGPRAASVRRDALEAARSSRS